MTRARSCGLICIQPAISSMVRPQPWQMPRARSMLQMPMQGVSTASAEAGAGKRRPGYALMDGDLDTGAAAYTADLARETRLAKVRPAV